MINTSVHGHLCQVPILLAGIELGLTEGQQENVFRMIMVMAAQELVIGISIYTCSVQSILNVYHMGLWQNQMH